MTSISFPDADAIGAAVGHLSDEERRALRAIPHDDGTYEVSGPDEVIAALSSPPSKGLLAAYAADRRWRAETGGIEVLGARIDTRREDQSMITGAYAWSQAHPEQTVAFKSRDGFVTLDATAVAAIASAVGNHVQACFAAEATVVAAIEAETIVDFAGVDAAAWPGASAPEPEDSEPPGEPEPEQPEEQP